MITSRGYFSKNLAGDFVIWWYYNFGNRLLLILRYFLIRIWDTFSIGLLATSLFAPWKQDVTATKGVPLNIQLKIMVMNLISRIIGFIVRFIVMIFGFLVWLLAIFISGIALGFYAILPLGVIILFLLGIIYLFK